MQRCFTSGSGWVVALLLMAGCARTPPLSDSGSGGGLQAYDQLVLQSASESARAEAVIPVPQPPGLGTAVLYLSAEPVLEAGLAVRMTAIEAAAQAAGTQSAQGTQGNQVPATTLSSEGREITIVSETVSPDDARESLRRYLEGTDAALAGQHRSAIALLDDSARLNPDQPEVWRRLAESWTALGSAEEARRMHEQALRLDPDHVQTRLALAWSNAERRDAPAVLAVLAPAWPFEESFVEDPIGRRLAYLLVSRAAQDAGWSRAFLEAGHAALELPWPQAARSRDRHRMSVLLRHEADLLLALGDIAAQLGDGKSAEVAWTRVAALPPSARSTAVARLVWLQLSRGAVARAQLVVLDAIAGRTDRLDARESALCRWLLSQISGGISGGISAGLSDPLADQNTGPGADARFRLALQDVMDRDAASEFPQDEAIGRIRLRAMIDPSVASLAALEQSLIAAPDDMMSSHVLLAGRGSDPDGPAAALETAARLVDRAPHRLAAIVAQLRRALVDPLAVSPSDATTPAAEAMRIRLLMEGWQLGPAWRALEVAHQRWPNNRRLAQLSVAVAVELDEPALVDAAIDRCAPFSGGPSGGDGPSGDGPSGDGSSGDGSSGGDGWTQVVLSRGLSRMGRYDEADVAARRARAIEATRLDGELARAENIARRSAVGPPAEHARQRAEVIAIARQLVAEAPERDEPWVLLTTAAFAGGQPDAALLQETIRGLQSTRLRGALLPTLLASVEARRGLFETSMRYASLAHLAEPAARLPLTLMTGGWVNLGQSDRAIALLQSELDHFPNDPVLHDQLIRMFLQSEQADAARAIVAHRLAAQPDEPLGLILAELVASAEGEMEVKADLAGKRLRARPPGPRRAIEYASALAHAGRFDEALDSLRWLTDHLDQTRREQFGIALGIFSQITNHAEADLVLAAMVDAGTKQFDLMPLSIYAIGLRALARSAPDESGAFRVLARRAAAQARGADDSSLRGAIPWSQLAQRLIDDGHPAAAARAVRYRLVTPQVFSPEATTILTTMAIACQGASESGGAADTLRLLQELDELERLSSLMISDGVSDLAAALDWASRIYSILGDTAGADRLLSAAVALGVGDPMILNNLGYLRIELGDGSPEVVAWIEAAGAAFPDDSAVVDTVGWLRYKQGRFSDGDGAGGGAGEDDGAEPGAVTLLGQSLRLAGALSPDGLLHHGDALWRVGRRDEARKEWEAAVRLLERPGHRSEQIELYRRMQAGTWGVTVLAPEAMYDRTFGAQLEQARGRIDALDRGEEPPVAQTFAELNGESNRAPDGWPGSEAGSSKNR